jgi:hypothetical protein
LLKAAVGSLALATASVASAQHAGHMPGMTMPMPAAKKPAASKPVARKAAVKKAAVTKSAVKKAAVKRAGATKAAPARGAARAASPAPVIDHGAIDHGAMDMGGSALPAPPATSGTAPPPAGHGHIDHGQMDMAPPGVPAIDHGKMDMGQPAMAAMDHGTGGHAAMRGALGPYPSAREASGTAWQPDSSDHRGYMKQSGDWMLMLHGNLDVVADAQGGRRGDDKIFPAGMVMGMATRNFASGDALQFKAMLSPDPLMGKKGYPLLLASGETADGETRLVDRQHPHDLFMELSASYSLKLGAKNSAFLYAGLPGEPAFGPPAFMHRQSISVSPEAPISHHWLDSTHITFGVVTAGLVLDRVKLEASRFNGREPDQKRFNIETGALDSTALRLSWNPTRELSLQGSWAHLEDPEQLEPGIDQRRWSASAIYTRAFSGGSWSSTLAWGRKAIDGEAQDAVALESSITRGDWTMFGRGEMTQNSELLDSADHGPSYRVAKASLGVARDFELGGPLAMTVGALGSVNFIPDGLRGAYGGRHPLGGMDFVRIKVERRSHGPLPHDHWRNAAAGDACRAGRGAQGSSSRAGRGANAGRPVPPCTAVAAARRRARARGDGDGADDARGRRPLGHDPVGTPPRLARPAPRQRHPLPARLFPRGIVDRPGRTQASGLRHAGPFPGYCRRRHRAGRSCAWLARRGDGPDRLGPLAPRPSLARHRDRGRGPRPCPVGVAAAARRPQRCDVARARTDQRGTACPGVVRRVDGPRHRPYELVGAIAWPRRHP